MTARFVVLCPLHDAPGGDVETVLRERADTLAAKRAAGTASYDELDALDALRNLLGSDGSATPSESTSDAPLLLRQREAAQLLGVSLSTVEWLRRTGQLPSVNVGASVRIRRSDLEAYVAGLEVGL